MLARNVFSRSAGKINILQSIVMIAIINYWNVIFLELNLNIYSTACANFFSQFYFLRLPKTSVTFDLTGNKMTQSGDAQRADFCISQLPPSRRWIWQLLRDQPDFLHPATTLWPRSHVSRVWTSDLFLNAMNQTFRTTLWGAILKEYTSIFLPPYCYVS